MFKTRLIQLSSIATIVALCFPIVANAQDDRVDDAPPKVTTVGSLTSATGWLKNDAGKWISRANRIPDDAPATLIDFENYALGYDNFTALELKEVTYIGKTSTLFVKKRKNGMYRYASSGWFTFSTVDLMVLSDDDKSQLDSLQYDSLTVISLKPKLSNTYDILSGITVNATDEIKKTLEGKGFTIYTQQYYLVIKPVKAKQVVRFLFTDQDYKTKEISTHYYETTIVNFKKLFPKMVIY